MTISYTLTIKHVATSSNDALTDAVTKVEWERRGTCSETSRFGRFNGITIFKLADIQAEGFTAFADLTETQVKAWVQSDIDADEEFLYDMNLNIQRQVERPVVSEQPQRLPWVQYDDAAPETD